MRLKTMAALLLFGSVALATASDSVGRGFKMVSTVLYQPEPVLQKRLPSVHALAAYMKALEGVCNTFFKKSDTTIRKAFPLAVNRRDFGPQRPTHGHRFELRLGRGSRSSTVTDQLHDFHRNSQG